jgi:hypothetical protein
MRRTRTLALVGCFAALVPYPPRPAAAAISALPAIQYNKADGALVQRVHGKWERKSAYDLYHRYGQHACYAGYLPFGFRPSVYYGCPGYGWPYWRPPEAASRPENFRTE